MPKTATAYQPRALAVFYGYWNSQKTLLYSAKVLEMVLQSIYWMR